MPATPSSTTTVAVADAVAAEINTPVSGTVWLQLNADCSRKWLPAYTDIELAERVRIAVIPINEQAERIARKLVRREHLVKLWLQKKVDPDPATRDAAIDELVLFAVQVKDYFLTAHRVLSTIANVYCMKSELHVSHSPKDLAEHSLWVSVIELTFHETTNQ
jgi:hypothetical protein